MSTIQNLKNFIRHGKQARMSVAHGEPITNVTTVYAEPQRKPQSQYQPGMATGTLDAIDQHQRSTKAAAAATAKSQARAHEQEIEQIVAEEKLNRSKLPSYPGLERYILVEKMGDGAFSNVYRARYKSGQSGEVAIKVVRKFEMSSKQRASILKEVQIMRQLDHPNIVKLIEFSESPQFYYIVLELCPGGELFHQIVRLTYFSENLSRHVILQVAKAIEYLHEESGVVHRDIKPENLLFYPAPFTPTKNPKPPAPGDEDKVDEGEFIPGIGSGGIGVIKVADFGLSKVIWDNETMTPCGTVGYTAPEIVKDERYSKSVDMWALGCVLYTLLCGFPPFYDESIQALTEKVARGQYTFLSPWWDDISKSAQDLVSHLLTVDPEKRYTIKEFLTHPWIRETDEETTAADDAPPLATPLLSHANKILETPLTGIDPNSRRADFRSPGAMNLREVFDVGYAVHRQEEEAKRRKAGFKVGYRGAALDPLSEVEHAEQQEYSGDDAESQAEMHYYDQGGNPVSTLPYNKVQGGQQRQQQPRTGYNPDVAAVENKLRGTNLSTGQQQQQLSAAAQARRAAGTTTASRQPQQRGRQPYQQGGYGQHSAAVAAAARENAARSAQQPFELSLDNATLLGRRGRRMAGQPVS
ncbi:serine/threonine-protein kinase srk1 [Microsporum canis CBS 113480]|uniref:Serine/threonine-protein kinase srk1 n=1 Tax=Arthroderma otae (strain ATCC MYA-4605 / CBS 113480) TaxID=554155 RepID=C5FSI2_ARTOC|nr:serine/threonine-protein kinase srk1 [Microsporum canis CBS 113480]EEQ32835.1 serine/threonine-protein kinase srk1 [Microsporum canis CBS 113480]